MISGEAILEAIRQEREACDGLAILRAEQRVLIDSGEAERLLEVLSRKQQAIDLIMRLEAQLKPVRADWDRLQMDFPASLRFSISDGFREIRDQLEELISQENEDAEVLSRRKEQVQEELSTLGRKRRLESAYRGGQLPPGLAPVSPAGPSGRQA